MSHRTSGATFGKDLGVALEAYGRYRWSCHGAEAVGGGVAPNLRTSAFPADSKAFDAVVRGGALLARGMPKFAERSDSQIESIRQYLRDRAAAMRAERSSNKASEVIP